MEQKKKLINKKYLKYSIINIFIKRGKKSNLEFFFYKLIKNMKKKTIQNPYFYIFNQLKKLYIYIKINKIYSNNFIEQDGFAYILKKKNFNKQLKDSIKLLISNKKNINFFFYSLNNINYNNIKKKKLINIEQNKFNIYRIL